MSANASDMPSCASQLHTRLSPLVWHCMKRIPSSLSSNVTFAYRSLYSEYLERLVMPTSCRFTTAPFRPMLLAIGVPPWVPTSGGLARPIFVDARHLPAGPGPQCMYVDRLERRDGAWRIALRRSTLELLLTADASTSQSKYFTEQGYIKGTTNAPIRRTRDLFDGSIASRW